MTVEKLNAENNLVKEILSKIKSSDLKIFPDDFLNDTTCYIENVPDKILYMASELFGKFEIRTSDGEFFKMIDDIYLAKYYVYSSMQRKPLLKIPSNNFTLIEIISEYEKYFDNIVKMINNEISNSGLNVNKMKIINDIIFNLNLTRL